MDGPGAANPEKPLLPLVAAMTAAEYLDFVHTPVYAARRGSPPGGSPAAAVTSRLLPYDALGAPGVYDALESLTSTYPATIPVVWLPVAAGLCLRYALSHGAGAAEAAGLALAALAAWSAVEWLVHRALFHVDDLLPRAAFGFRAVRLAHFLAHGLHHARPDDPGRLVMAPALGGAIALGGWAAARRAFPALEPEKLAFMFGCALVWYVAYDLTHYALHHAAVEPGGGALRAAAARAWTGLRARHAAHHALGEGEGAAYGISLPAAALDVVFGTCLPDAPPPRRARAVGGG